VTAAIDKWVVSEAGLKGLLSMADDTVLDANRLPSMECWVPFKELKEDLLERGVGEKRLKYNQSEMKLAIELNALGYPKGTKGAKTRKGKDTTAAVRYGLRKRDPDDDVVVFGQDGPSSSSGTTAAVEESLDDDL